MSTLKEQFLLAADIVDAWPALYQRGNYFGNSTTKTAIDPDCGCAYGAMSLAADPRPFEPDQGLFFMIFSRNLDDMEHVAENRLREEMPDAPNGVVSWNDRPTTDKAQVAAFLRRCSEDCP